MVDPPAHDDATKNEAGNDDPSPRTRRRARSLSSSNKKSESPVSRRSPQGSTKSADGGGSTRSCRRAAAATSPDSKMELSDDEVSQDLSMKESKSIEEAKDDSEVTADSPQVLEAVLPDGTAVTVRVMLNEPQSDATEAPTFVGQDGNNFYCEICNGVGEIVCCDGCPKVYHQTCIEDGSPSRIALDNDADPWYCPDCLGNKSKGTSFSGSSRRASKRVCSECRQANGDSPLLPCETCGVYIHHPPCRAHPDDVNDDMDEDSPVLCSNCAAGEVVSQEEDELGLKERASQEEEPRRSKRRSSIGASSMDDAMSDDHGDDGDKKPRSKRKRSVDHSAERPTSAKRKKDSAKGPSSSAKKRKTTRKRLATSYAEDASDQSESPIYDRPIPRPYTAPRGMVKATPAFFFFLNDNRYKIERVLSRKHRYFNRLPKGLERNQLIAREAAIWWVKLRPREHRRYINLSMRDFEERVIEWKEEHGGALFGAQDGVDGGVDGVTQTSDLTRQDEKITFDRHQKLYVDTSVGSKPFVPEPGKSNNRLLLELLQDMRFHPVPMLKADRDDDEPGALEYSKMSIPYFGIHGPVATSIGDECLGCTRGWNHFCHVLKRRIPGVENRAKLQAPLSALMATRVGLGLRPRMPTRTEDAEATEEQWRDAKDFSVRETSEAEEAKKLPPISSYSLTQPSDRADDIVNFMEAATAMKIPEPPRPAEPVASRPRLSRGALPMHGRKKKSDLSHPTVNKCGRCRTVIQTDTGCVPCRRAQLVINMSKNQSSKSGEDLLKVQTAMLGRLSTKDSNYDEQNEEDRAIADAMVKVRWTPNAILPPQSILVPEHLTGSSVGVESSSDSQDSLDEETSLDISVEDTVVPGLTGDVGASKGLGTIEEEASENDIVMSTSNETEGAEDTTTDERTSRRQRARRESMFSTAAVEEEEADRRQMAREQHEETAQLNRRCLSVASCGILLAMIRRDPLLLFAEPVPADVEAYSKIIPDPIDFSKIKSNVLNEEYKTLAAFISDARRLCTNALAYNPVGTIYNKTAKELLDVLETMQKRATKWTTAIKDAHASSFTWRKPGATGILEFGRVGVGTDDDPFRELRQTWPEAVEILESGDWLKSQVAADFVRTRENEAAYYGSLAIRRAAAAAEASLAPYPGTGGEHTVVVKRNHAEDEALRVAIDKRVAEETAAPVELKSVPGWREESILKMLRKVQTRRVEARVTSQDGCARCDGTRVEQDSRLSTRAEAVRWGRNKKKGEIDTIPRVVASRIPLSTGMGSAKNREARENKQTEADLPDNLNAEIGENGVSVRGSRIHGWGLFADQPFKQGDVVAEYVGEYVTHASADAREKMYQEQRIQDYQFRADELVVDATKKGGHGRYINHNCSPNCIAKIVEGKPPNRHLKRVIIIAQSNIAALEEITYDYQFPLELDLDARIPCNCGSTSCRGFMNWDLPEKGAKNRITRGSKRGGNMRDRIRRLNRPRKRDET